MKKFKDIQVTRSGSLGRPSRFIVLSSTLAVMISLVGLRAGASTNDYTAAKLAAHTVFAMSSHDNPNNASSRHHGGGYQGQTTTTLAPAPTTTTTGALLNPVSAPTTPSTLAPSLSPTTTVLSPVPTTTTPAPTTTTTAAPAPAPTTTTTTAPSTLSPLGIPSSSEPSGMAPPSNSLAGYTQSYVTDFAGSSLPSGWYAYNGNPGGDPGAQWSGSHVVVGNGLLSLNTWQDPAFNNSWVAGGLCQCGVQRTYGAYFVRSRLTGAGPTGVALLWPAASVWPPEIDFNESYGGTTSTSATVHYGASNQQIHSSLKIDMTQWHTWGVIWTPTSVTYTVDGKVWGSVTTTSAIPNQAMTLDLQQQTWCGSGWACPSAPQSMQVDWVA